MRRKIIKQANQAYTITLPIEWVRKNGLSEKSEIDLLESGKSLVINSDKPMVGGKAIIELAELGSKKDLNTCLNALYARGIDEVEVISDEEISSQITLGLNSLIGYALISKDKNKYIIKDVGGSNYSDLDGIFKRVFQIILLFYEDAAKDMLEEQKENLENINIRDKEVNKFCLYLQRAISKQLYQDTTNGRIFFTYSYALEKLGDDIYRLWKANISYKIKKSKEVRELLELVREGLGESFDNYYAFNIKRISRSYQIREKVREKALSIKTDSKTASFIGYAVRIIEETTDLNHLTLMKKLGEEKRK